MKFQDLLALGLLVAPVLAQVPAIPYARSFQAARAAAPGDSDYQRGLSALDARKWDEAIGFFRDSASHKPGNADAALYWLAYAQSHAGQRENALATIQQLRQSYASSRWMRDANALAVELRAENGNPVSPAAESDQDLKLLALNSLLASSPEKALPILRKILAGNDTSKLKERALFVLVQNPSPEARKMLDDMARSTANPDLQLKAIRYMGMMGGVDARNQLGSIYSSSSDERVKRAILKSYMISGARGPLLAAAKGERDPDLRREAIRQLALIHGNDELWQLFQQSNSNDDKKAILQSMFLTGDSTRLVEMARSLKDRELKLAAIKSLGLMGSGGQSDALVSIYQSDTDPNVRRAVINALFIQQNAKSLIALARAEKDPRMKAEIVQKLALIQSPEASEYMMEILK